MEAVAESGLAEIAVICDYTPECLANARMAAPRARVARTLDEMLEHDLDGVVIATPSALHAEQATQVLRSGLPVFCQKPLGRTANETHLVVSTARESDRLIGVDFSYRHTTAMQQVREIVRRGEIGNIFAADLVFHNAHGPDKPWFYDQRLSGGGCVMDLGIHLVDLALWALNFPKVTSCSSRLFAKGLALSDFPDSVEDFALARLDLGTGAAVQLACSWKLHVGCDAVISAYFYGTEGVVGFRNVNGSFYDFLAERFEGTRRETIALPPDAWGGRAIVEWVRRLSRSDAFDPEAERLVEIAAIVDAIYGRL